MKIHCMSGIPNAKAHELQADEIWMSFEMFGLESTLSKLHTQQYYCSAKASNLFAIAKTWSFEIHPNIGAG